MAKRSITVSIAVLVANICFWVPSGVEAQGSNALDQIGTYPLSTSKSIAMRRPAQNAPVGPLRPRGLAPRILLISSGVQQDIFPAAAQLGMSGSLTDTVGYGTMAAAQILQFAPTAQIISGSVYPNGKFDPVHVRYGLEWAAQHSAEIDSVLLAFPPSLLIDPISGSMQNGTFDRIFDVLAATSSPGPTGQLFGAPYLPMTQFERFIEPLPYYERAAMTALRTSWQNFLWPRWEISKLKDLGVSVVMPAGDTGGKPQSILGLANLPDVITVGGFDGNGVSVSSAAGPGMDGSVKPDLIAPTSTMGLVPEGSLLAQELRNRNLLIESPSPDWGPLGAPSSQAKGARLDSTMSAAASVATMVAGLRREGITSTAAQRGALVAKAQPLPGVEVWRQGAGLISEAPDAAYTNSRPLATLNASLGLEPASGEWSTTIPFLNGSPLSGSAVARDHIWTTPLAKAAWVTLSAVDAPTALVQPSSGSVKVSVDVKRGEAGGYCGYVSVALPNSQFDDIPMCLFETVPMGVARAFYVHEESAEDETFALHPALPPAADLLDHPLHLLPVNPIDHDMFSSITSSAVCAGSTRPCGHANMSGILPGYYKVKLHADYATPFMSAGTLIPSDGNPAYQSVKTLLLPPADCPFVGTYKDGGDWHDSWSSCTTTTLENAATGFKVEGPDATASYTITPDTTAVTGSPSPSPTSTSTSTALPDLVEPLKVNLGFLKKLVGTAVSGRYIDVIDQCRDMRYLRLPGDGNFRPSDLSSQEQPVEQGLWRFGCDKGAVPSLPGASLSPAIGRYDFKLPTPNYSAQMGIDFKYDLQNALVFVVAVVGPDIQWAVISPDGLSKLSSTDGSTWSDPNSYTRIGLREGTASLSFRFLPRGVSDGQLYFAFVPSQGFGVARATIDALSMSLRTWTNVDWPGAQLANCKEKCGHAFAMNPQITLDAGQSQPWTGQFRSTSNCVQRPTGSTCEDWSMLAHVPHNTGSHYGAHLADIRHNGGSAFEAVRAAGGYVSTPGRTGEQIFDGVEVLAYADWSWYVQPRLSIEKRHIRSNGRFFDLLKLPVGYLQSHQGDTQVCIRDRTATTPLNSPCAADTTYAPLPSPAGPPTLAPYYTFANT